MCSLFAFQCKGTRISTLKFFTYVWHKNFNTKLLAFCMRFKYWYRYRYRDTSVDTQLISTSLTEYRMENFLENYLFRKQKTIGADYRPIPPTPPTGKESCKKKNQLLHVGRPFSVGYKVNLDHWRHWKRPVMHSYNEWKWRLPMKGHFEVTVFFVS